MSKWALYQLRDRSMQLCSRNPSQTTLQECKSSNKCAQLIIERLKNIMSVLFTNKRTGWSYNEAIWSNKSLIGWATHSMINSISALRSVFNQAWRFSISIPVDVVRVDSDLGIWHILLIAFPKDFSVLALQCQMRLPRSKNMN